MKPTRTVVLVASVIGLGLAPIRALAGPSDVFKVGGRTPKTGWVTFDETAPDPVTVKSPMLSRLDGVAATLDKDSLRELRRSARGAPKGEVVGERRWVVHLEHEGELAQVEILDTEQGWVARSLTSPGDEALLRTRWFTSLAGTWLTQSSDRSGEVERGRMMDLGQPYEAGAVRLKKDVMADRYGASGAGREPLSGITRVLEEEQMWVRLPAGYDRAVPAGVLVWVSPSEKGRLPKEFFPTLDETNIIACGFDNAGNFRKTRDGSTHGIVDRLQLMFDALETTRAGFSVDDDRVYIAGFSGGGRVSSILTCTFPEVFRGAVPIVGLDSYKHAYVEKDKYVPARFPKPKGDRWELLMERRMWALTGSKDFNLVEIRARVKDMEGDGLQIKLHSTPGMVHAQMPEEDVVSRALLWVDEPARTAREAGLARADELWGEYVERFGNRSAPGDEAKDLLIEITLAGPFGASAWRAAELLGYERPAR